VIAQTWIALRHVGDGFGGKAKNVLELGEAIGLRGRRHGAVAWSRGIAGNPSVVRDAGFASRTCASDTEEGSSMSQSMGAGRIGSNEIAYARGRCEPMAQLLINRGEGKEIISRDWRLDLGYEEAYPYSDTVRGTLRQSEYGENTLSGAR